MNKIIPALIVGIIISAMFIVAGQTMNKTSEKAAQPAEAVSQVKNDKPEIIDNSRTAAASDDEYNGEKITKSEDEWKKLLTAEQFYVLREKGTEAPDTGEYTNNHEHGDYYCAACHLKLFSSKAKFESGTGWASFYQPVSKKNVLEENDTSYGMTRTEVNCPRCNSHLGHVFDDGPKPTGLRYCMNSIALKFEKRK